MKLTIDNIGKVRHADLDLDGMTVIIGDNNMGKSTVGKVLYSVFHSFSHMIEGVKDARTDYILTAANVPNANFIKSRFGYLKTPVEELDDERLKGILQMAYERQRPYRLVGRYKASPELQLTIDEAAERVRTYAMKAKSISELDLAHDVITADLNKYFDDQFLSVFKDSDGAGQIELTVQGKKIKSAWGNGVEKMTMEIHLSSDAWFVGSPLALNSIAKNNPLPGRRISFDPMHDDLVIKLRRSRPGDIVAKRVADMDLRQIYELLDQRLSANFEYQSKEGLAMSMSELTHPLHAVNLSMGLKTFALLRMMLEANILKAKDVLVLDEPENHLHPASQVLFAEIVVLLQRIYSLTVLLTTHSPYFLEAIELYSRKYIKETGKGAKLKVYQPKKVDAYGRIEFDDVSDNTTEMYRKFAAALRELDLLRNDVESYSEVENA